jgi:hypothetical protein
MGPWREGGTRREARPRAESDRGEAPRHEDGLRYTVAQFTRDIDHAC